MVYNISNEPTYGFKRKVEVAQIHIGFMDFVNKSVSLYFIVKYYEADNTPITIIPSKSVILRADNTTWVDVDGNIVEEGSLDAIMTEYDFFMMLMDQPIIISDIVESKVTWADSLGRFN